MSDSKNYAPLAAADYLECKEDASSLIRYMQINAFLATMKASVNDLMVTVSRSEDIDLMNKMGPHLETMRRIIEVLGFINQDTD